MTGGRGRNARDACPGDKVSKERAALKALPKTLRDELDLQTDGA